MKALRSLVACLGLFLAVVLLCDVDAALATTPAAEGSAGFGNGALVVPGVEQLLGGEEAQAQREAVRANPVAVSERELSRTRYAADQAAMNAAARAEAELRQEEAEGLIAGDSEEYEEEEYEEYAAYHIEHASPHVDEGLSLHPFGKESEEANEANWRQ
jgi:hypothetical protein